MALTKREVLKLNNILWRMKEAHKYLSKPETIICLKTKTANSDSFINKEGQPLTELTKFVGSELNQLNNAIYCMEELLNPDTL